MAPFITIVAPRFLDLMGRISTVFGSISGIGGMTLWPVIIVRKPMSAGMEAHEGTHAIQQMFVPLPAAIVCAVFGVVLDPMWLLGLVWCWFPYLGPFYIWYGAEYLVRYLYYRDGDEAYYRISFEQQAYATSGKTGIDTNPVGWVKYLFVWNGDR